MTTKEVVLITGANTGIGYETVAALVQTAKPYHILLGSRTPSKGEDAASELAKRFPETDSTVEVVQIDVTDDESIGKLAELVNTKFGRLDVLINNAGAAFDTSFMGDLTSFRALFNKTYDVNVSGTQVMTATFAPLLIKAPSPRLVFLTSGLSNLTASAKTSMPPWAPPPPSGWPKDNLVSMQSYKACKTALNMLMLTWHWILKEDGVRTWCVSPGFLATDLGGKKELLKKAGAGDPALGGDLICKVIQGERDEDVGTVVTQNGEVQPW